MLLVVLNVESSDSSDPVLNDFCNVYNLFSLVKEPTCFKNPYIPSCTRPATTRGAGSHDPPLPTTTTFLRSKKKKRKPREKRTIFKAETIEKLSPRSKYYCFSHSRVSRIQKFLLSANHGG